MTNWGVIFFAEIWENHTSIRHLKSGKISHFFHLHFKKSHLNSSPKIGQNIKFFPSSFQKITPQFGAFGTPLCTPESRFVAFGTRFWTPGSHFFVHSGFLDSISDLLDSILGLGVSIVSNLGLGGIIWASKNRRLDLWESNLGFLDSSLDLWESILGVQDAISVPWKSIFGPIWHVWNKGFPYYNLKGKCK